MIAFFQFILLMDNPLHTETAKASIANPIPIINISKKQEIVEQINKNRVIIVSGNTGCGKSTQVPQYIFENNKDFNSFGIFFSF